MIKNVIRIDIMYRDASNFKNCDSEYFNNESNISIEDIEKVLKPLFYNPVMVQDYGIKSIAPIENEFYPVFDDLNHAFCELLDVASYQMSGLDEDATDIKMVLKLVKSKSNKSEERKKEAIEILENHINELKAL